MLENTEEKEEIVNTLKQKLIEHKKWDSKLKELRKTIGEQKKTYAKTEEDIKALQSVGQIIGEVLKQLDEERFIVKASSGPRYVVSCRTSVCKDKLKQGVRVSLDMTTLTIMRILPREVDPLVYNMSLEDPGKMNFTSIGGLNEQIRKLREIIELPLKNPELFRRVGIKPPKGVLLYGPPGTGKTLLARAVASSLGTNFLKVVSSAIVDKYIGESSRLIREMFGYAKEHEPCIIFMDEIDAIGGRRFSEGTSADREIQRTLMELLNCMDGFDYLGQTKIIMATNRPDTLDPALLRPGRLDRKIEIPLPNEQGRFEILKIHAQNIQKQGEIDYEAIVKLSDSFNGADLRNVITEAGFFAIRDDRDYVVQNDLMKAVRKVAEAKRLEDKLEYKKI
ncbi:26S protease regulatory subunit 10B [Pneumocystis jirovecii RU7]|uniref:26S protease regulatory subunit 10B n=1 Tax=Pneumocystis jirovecii (strain RU7) TaxID=1408657 RepID=A0A0W4ZIM2_PNEJ7|nr:26S protease regulatory subunit 10B [Pneumocystis jirovecii RU7]KTW28212.1 26S protease regulatory subunit 10B [Pneumocystis jirovecii RU7]